MVIKHDSKFVPQIELIPIKDLTVSPFNVRDKFVPVLRRYDVVHAAVFGSFVRGEMKEGSDIDVLVEFRGEKSLLDLVALKIELEEVLGRNVDVLTYDSLHPFIKETILKEQVVIL